MNLKRVTQGSQGDATLIRLRDPDAEESALLSAALEIEQVTLFARPMVLALDLHPLHQPTSEFLGVLLRVSAALQVRSARLIIRYAPGAKQYFERIPCHLTETLETVGVA